jgi:arsenate reductase-like glutaredoxin family protein
LAELAKLGGIPVQGLLNKKSKTYKELGKELEESNEMAVASFLAVNPKAIIRPLIAGNDELVLGFKANDKNK